MPESSRSARLRAWIIAAAILLYGFAALPLPHSVRASNLDGATGWEEIERWVGIFESLGIEVTHRGLRDRVLSIGQATATFRRTVLRPFRPWLRTTGTGQSWALFAHPDTHPRRLVVSGTTGEDGSWQLLFRSRDPDASLLRPLFRYRRVRALWDSTSRRKRPGSLYERFTDEIALRVFEERPDVQRVRIQFERLESRRPEHPMALDVETLHTRIRTREDVL